MKRSVIIAGVVALVIAGALLIPAGYHEHRESGFREQANQYGGIDIDSYWNNHKKLSFNHWYTPEEFQNEPEYLKLSDAGKQQSMKEYYSARTGYEDYLASNWENAAGVAAAIGGALYALLALCLLPGVLFRAWLKFIRETSKAIRGDK
ncbi:TPA: hypothetical protein NQS24_002242 [Klebsiella pneumoniae]|nr:hypothetical protein [Klebsiella pneumoniae]HBX0707455.1 hypothetical protein [Klebsiella pneumoniae]HCB0969495.1 hypothetical protein [Klebsiella pneumoniae]HCB1251197.1 hypothetical protein [Klebsiella pneumoniae]HCJ2336395.1 hypothetical protein [Klebsiella pneumoniae]